MLVRIGEPLEEAWHLYGTFARVWGYTASFRQFELRLLNGIPGWNLTLSCLGTETFRGPVEWCEPRLYVEPLGDERVRIADPRVDFEAFVERVWIGEGHQRRRPGRDAFQAYHRISSSSDPQPLLDKWRGGLGCILGYEPFARSAELRVGPEPDNLRILCFGVKSFRGPGRKWEDADFSVEPWADGLVRVHDGKADVEVIAEKVHVLEQDQPSLP